MANSIFLWPGTSVSVASLSLTGTTSPMFVASSSIAGQSQWQFTNTSTDPLAYANIRVASGPVVAAYLGATNGNASATPPASGPLRAWLDAPGTNTGWDIIASAAQAGTSIRFYTQGYNATNQRALMDSNGLTLLNAGAIREQDQTNGQTISLLQTLTELTTIAAAASTDTTIQMPATSVVLAVTVRVVTVIPTAATFTVGDSGSAARFSTAAVAVAAGSTDPGTKAGAYYNASALSIRLTPDVQPVGTTGQVRVVIYYYTVTPPTS